MEMFKYFMFYGLLVPLIWPVIYILYKKGSNKLLFVASVVGVIVLTEVLLAISLLPVTHILLRFLPTFQEYGWDIYLSPLISIATVIQKWYWVILYPPLFGFLPMLIYRKYKLFQ